MKYELIEQNQEPKYKFGRLVEEVTFIMSMPRLAFSDNMFSLQNATYNLGLYGKRHSGAFWEQGIENLLEDAIEAGYKYALAIDYDTFYNSYHIIDLYNLMEENPDVGVLFPLQPRRGNYYPMAGYFMDDFGHMVKVAKGGFVNGIKPCDTGHFGLTMIRLSELSKLKKPWFISITNSEGNWRIKHKDADVHFWIKCKNVGIKAALAEVWIGHLQLMCSWSGPESKRFETHYQALNDVLDGEIPEWALPKSNKLKKGKGVSKMATDIKENPKCDRCGGGPTNLYNPNTPGFPTKRVNMCDKCATEASPKPTLVEAAGKPASVDEKVPDIAPAVPEPDIKTSKAEFAPKVTDVPVVSAGGQVDVQAVKQKITAQEKDVDRLLVNRQKLQDQFTEITNMIIAKRGAIAGLRDLIKNAG
jgi:hypothetical protein